MLLWFFPPKISLFLDGEILNHRVVADTSCWKNPKTKQKSRNWSWTWKTSLHCWVYQNLCVKLCVSFILEEEEAETEAGRFHPFWKSWGEGLWGRWAGVTTSSREEAEEPQSQGRDGNSGWSRIREGDDCFSTVCHSLFPGWGHFLTHFIHRVSLNLSHWRHLITRKANIS